MLMNWIDESLISVKTEYMIEKTQLLIVSMGYNNNVILITNVQRTEHCFRRTLEICFLRTHIWKWCRKFH